MQIWDLHPKDSKPIAYHRGGDSQEVMQQWEQAGCLVKAKDAGYRSIHYVIVDKPNKRDQFCAEIQVRTIFEEAWSEIDHNVRYPDYSDDPLLSEFLLILNRIAGSADEMGSFLLRFRERDQFQNSLIEQHKKESQERKGEITLLEANLEDIKKALDEAVKKKAISEQERRKLEQTLNSVPAIFRRDLMEDFIEQNKKFQEQFNRDMKALMGNPGGSLRLQLMDLENTPLRASQISKVQVPTTQLSLKGLPSSLEQPQKAQEPPQKSEQTESKSVDA